MRRVSCKRYSGIALVFVFLLSTSCSQPVLEPESCIAARDSVKRLYALHLDTEGGADDPLSRIRGLVSGRLFEELSGQGPGKDYLTNADELPKAARVGACGLVNGDPRFEVLLFWRRDGENIEKKVLVSVKNQNGWVTDRVTAAE